MIGSSTAPVAEGGDLFDLGQGKLWVGFVLRSVRRHRLAFLAAFLLVGILGSFLALASPKQYLSGTRLLARNDSQINGITVPNQTAGSSNQPPAVQAEPTIKAQANLERVVDSLHLVERYNVSETSTGRLKRRIMEKVFPAPDSAKKREEIVGLLRQNLTVDATAADKQTVDVSVIWTDPFIAKEIVDQVNENFFADRRTQEVGLVEEAKRIAEEQLESQNATVAKMRIDLDIPVFDDRTLPDSSPLRAELAIQQEYKQRVIDAETQLKNTEAAFSYRYKIVTPPELPVAPMSGSLSSIVLSLIGGGIVGAALTTMLDILRGRVVEAWQVSRRMNLPVLAELKG
jgi:uncharacterized protein involved in exopolysaccharide biosynthesis